MIEAAFPTLSPVHRHGDDGVEFFTFGQAAGKEPAQGLSEALYFSVLEKVNQLPEGTVIAAERVCGIEVDQTLPADGTKIVFVQRIIIHKRGSAGSAEEFGLKRLRQGKTGGTNRDPGNSC